MRRIWCTLGFLNLVTGCIDPLSYASNTIPLFFGTKGKVRWAVVVHDETGRGAWRSQNRAISLRTCNPLFLSLAVFLCCLRMFIAGIIAGSRRWHYWGMASLWYFIQNSAPLVSVSILTLLLTLGIKSQPNHSPMTWSPTAHFNLGIPTVPFIHCSTRTADILYRRLRVHIGMIPILIGIVCINARP